MANSFGPPGQVSPTMFSRTLERVFEDAQHTGEINLSGRKLKEYSKVAEKFDLVDTTTVGEYTHPDASAVLSLFLFICNRNSRVVELGLISQSDSDTLLCFILFPSG